MLTDYTDYRHFLKDVLVERRQGNSRYSLRAFARDLQMNPCRLSEIFNGKKGMSLEAASKLSKLLGLSDEETVYFCDLVQSAHARSATARKMAEIRLAIHDNARGHRVLLNDTLRVINDWYHLAILELTYVKEFQNNVSWIADRLGITPVEAEQAVERLKRLELLEERNGIFRKTTKLLTTTRDVPSDAIRKFSQQILEKAIEALASQPVEMREVSTMVMAIDPKNLPEAKKLITEFRRKLCALLESGEQRNVYCFTSQLFSLETRTPSIMSH